ncbi:MAG: hypothetical protein ACRDM9_09115, partial [Gaiellaceae bacterium]
MSVLLELQLRGAGGEPVDLRRTIASHGLVDLPPMRPDEDGRVLEVTVPLPGSRPRTVRIAQGRPRQAAVTVLGRSPTPQLVETIRAAVAHVLRLDEDLSAFYEELAADPDLSWAARGAGRMVRAPTVFEEVVKTICTTNCAWSATERMVGALVEHLGEPAAGAPRDGPYGRAFPTPEAMARAEESFYRDVVRAGYRGTYLRSLAASVAEGASDLEQLGQVKRDE